MFLYDLRLEACFWLFFVEIRGYKQHQSSCYEYGFEEFVVEYVSRVEGSTTGYVDVMYNYEYSY